MCSEYLWTEILRKKKDQQKIDQSSNYTRNSIDRRLTSQFLNQTQEDKIRSS